MARIRTDLIEGAADTWLGSRTEDFEANPEFLRGQVELIANVSRFHRDDEMELVTDAIAQCVREAAPDPHKWRRAMPDVLILPLRPRKGDEIFVVDQVGATFVFPDIASLNAAYKRERRAGAEELTRSVTFAPRGGMTWDELADYACSHGPDVFCDDQRIYVRCVDDIFAPNWDQARRYARMVGYNAVSGSTTAKVGCIDAVAPLGCYDPREDYEGETVCDHPYFASYFVRSGIDTERDWMEPK